MEAGYDIEQFGNTRSKGTDIDYVCEQMDTASVKVYLPRPDADPASHERLACLSGYAER